MFLINANVLDDKFCLRKADIEIEDGKIVRLEDSLPYKEEDLVVDCAGYTIVPGFVDVHVHGGAGADSSDGDVEGLRNMAKFLLTKGVTSFCPTTMTVSDAEILKALETIRSCMDDKEGAKIVGVNLEGPFISPKKRARKATSSSRRRITTCLRSITIPAAASSSLWTLRPSATCAAILSRKPRSSAPFPLRTPQRVTTARWTRSKRA